MKRTIIKIEDIPSMIFREFGGKSNHFQCKNGNYSEKKFTIGKKEGKIIFGKCSSCHVLIVLFAPFKESVKYDLLIRVGKVKEQSVYDEWLNNPADELVFYCKGLTLNVRKIDGALISNIIMDMIKGMINRPRY